ncbi:MAG: heme o synthase [Actinobacteria bacterium]|nr:heme o synthase [Actinomycetota bacterium]
MKSFQRLAIITTAAVIIQTSLGSFVRVSGSGLGCGTDWPKCRGRWIPPLETTAIIEYTHRMVATLLGFLVLAVVIFAWLKFRSIKWVFWPSLLALAFVGIQGWLGRQVVDNELAGGLVALHFFNAMMIIGLLTTTVVGSYYPGRGRWTRFAKEATAAAVTVMFVWMAGAWVAQGGAALVFGDWPLMGGALIPELTGRAEIIHFLHRVMAVVTGLAVGIVAFRAQELEPDARALRRFAHGALGLWVLQVAIGGITVLTRAAPAAVVAHVFVGSLLWASIVALAILGTRLWRADTQRGPGVGERVGVAPKGVAPRGIARTVKAYFFLTKPRIIELLLITTVPAMVVAADGWPPLALILATLIGGSLTAGSANSINCFIDRDIDEAMARTAERPLPRHEVEPRSALVFGIALGLIGFGWLAATVNLLAAFLAGAAILFYVFIYTIWMKRSTPSNIVIGGAAGAAPVLVGWAAVTGRVELPALVLFAIVFYWTPPHFWALALRYREDYSAAGVPMLPVVRGVQETTRQMVLYALILFAVSLLLYPVAGLGLIYLAAAVGMGTLFLIGCIRLTKAPSAIKAMGLFRHSITYLTVLFAAMATDRLVATSAPDWVAPLAFVVAVPIFFAAQAAVVFSVLGLRRYGEPLPKADGTLLIEIIWTALPSLVVALLFVQSWQSILR